MMGTVVSTSLHSALQRLKKAGFSPGGPVVRNHHMTTATSRHSNTVIRNRVSLPVTTDLTSTFVRMEVGEQLTAVLRFISC